VIGDVLEKLDPKLRKLLGTGSDFHIDRQPMPSILLTKALGGGLGYGRQVLIYGSKSAGKSTMLLQMVGMAQKAGKTCAWIDSEDSFDPEWARRLGVDTDALIVVNTKRTNDVVDIGTELMHAGIDIMVIDSISALMPSVYFEKDGTLKDLSDTKQMGADARDMTQAVKMLNYANDKTLLILVSQQRKALGSMFVSNIPTGGEAVRFFSSTVIKLFSSETENNAIKATIDIGGREIEKVVGREVSWVVMANKLGPAFESGKYVLMFAGDKVGVDTTEELVTALEEATDVKSGKWYKFDDKSYNGRPAFVAALQQDEELRNKVLDVLAN
jgi:recombination protein RecA